MTSKSSSTTVIFGNQILPTQQWSDVSTCAGQGAALGCGGGSSGRRFVPLRSALQQVVQAPEAACQIAQEALLPGAVLGREACAAHVGG